MKLEITIIDIMVVISVILFVILMAWWVLGSSPTLQLLGVFLGFVFLFYAVKNDKDIRTIKYKLNRLDDIYNILKEKL